MDPGTGQGLLCRGLCGSQRGVHPPLFSGAQGLRDTIVVVSVVTIVTCSSSGWPQRWRLAGLAWPFTQVGLTCFTRLSSWGTPPLLPGGCHGAGQ